MSNAQISVHKVCKSQDILRNVKIFIPYFKSLTWFLVAIPSLVGQCDTDLEWVKSCLYLDQACFTYRTVYIQVTHCNVNKPGPSTKMTLPILYGKKHDT